MNQLIAIKTLSSQTYKETAEAIEVAPLVRRTCNTRAPPRHKVPTVTVDDPRVVLMLLNQVQ